MDTFDFTIWRRLDWRMIGAICGLLLCSLVVVASTTQQYYEGTTSVWTPFVLHQLEWSILGGGFFYCSASFDYRKVREWTWPLYLVIILALLGLFFVPAIQGVHRWYPLPFTSSTLQPSEYAKLAVVAALAWSIERQQTHLEQLRTTLQIAGFALLPFLLILKQPDLGSAAVLLPITGVMLYLGGAHRGLLRLGAWMGGSLLVITALLFTEVIPHEQVRPWAATLLHDYQVDRLAPHSYHQRAATTAIAIGGLSGVGIGNSEFTGRGWLPAAHTDSVFPAFVEETGLAGALFLLALYLVLIRRALHTAVMARDLFGRLLGAGIATYLAVHIVINLGMMAGCLPITGVPLPLLSYGGSSLLSTMTALGLLQSIYARRFLFH